jgi:hypothetical protein
MDCGEETDMTIRLGGGEERCTGCAKKESIVDFFFNRIALMQKKFKKTTCALPYYLNKIALFDMYDCNTMIAIL